jgi:hypothetical protein
LNQDESSEDNREKKAEAQIRPTTSPPKECHSIFEGGGVREEIEGEGRWLLEKP